MKQYFTKYLPVEGEIKEGDTFKYKDLIFRDDGHIQQIEGRTKVKLFLCSRAIQVGDKVTYKDKEYEVTADSLESVKSSKNTFKIIGEISNPEITEGKEFKKLEDAINYCLNWRKEWLNQELSKADS